ncbi:hypothetical protein VTL71DRAFT_13156 [Oculimacula yallundae]|uniref:RanBP2-type domain-containing protein n=1 Tax=Oculimacula yallundae TaxID=86028 RepID=A0ABR4CPM1_9HELO
MMGESGLQHSKWAHTGGSTHNSHHRPGDWTCASCRFSNFQWRKSCFRCAADGADAPVARNSQQTMIPSVQFKRPYDGYRHQAEAVLLSSASIESTPIASGLSISRWAPRNANSNQSAQPNNIVWTRTSQQPLQPSSRSHTPISKAAELGLPYQVQHYILVMIERMLEESCFEFAGRWVPDILHAKGWDCAEAVELSTWKAFLPTVLPPNAIRPMSNYSLEGALGDAVRIRNSAVHRHLCDNDEIRRMALQAQDLMSMFADGTRQDKFHRLWLELKEWDSASLADAQGARGRLEAALQEISERPVDDMDWTPNAMSLQEVTVEVEAVQDPGHSEYIDEMELD